MTDSQYIRFVTGLAVFGLGAWLGGLSGGIISGAGMILALRTIWSMK